MLDDQIKNLVRDAVCPDGYIALDLTLTGTSTEGSTLRVSYEVAYITDNTDHLFDGEVNIEKGSLVIKEHSITDERETAYCDDLQQDSEVIVSIDELLEKPRVVKAWKEMIVVHISEDDALEHFDFPENRTDLPSKPTGKVFDDICLDVLSNWMPDTPNVTGEFDLFLVNDHSQKFVKAKEFEPNKTLSAIRGVIIDGMPRGGGTHNAIKGRGLKVKLDKLKEKGCRIESVNGVFDSRDAGHHCYFINGVSFEEATALIGWTDERLGLIVDSEGMGIAYNTSI